LNGVPILPIYRTVDIINEGNTMLRSTFLFILSAIFVLSGIALQAQENTEPSSSNQQYVPHKAKNMHATVLEFGEGNLESIKLDDNGAPWSIWGNLNKGITASDPLERCYQFFELHKELLALDNPREDMVVKVQREETIRFYQYFKGIKTHNSHSIHFNPKDGNDIVGYSASPDPEVRSVDTNYEISKEQAQQIAVAHCQTLHPDLIMTSTQEPELQINRFESGCRLIWKVIVFRGMEPYYSYSIDAHNGEVLEYIISRIY